MGNVKMITVTKRLEFVCVSDETCECIQPPRVSRHLLSAKLNSRASWFKARD